MFLAARGPETNLHGVGPAMVSRQALYNIEHGRTGEAIAAQDALVKARPSWHAYLARANLLLKCAALDSDPCPRAKLAAKDCQASLGLQKNPLAYYLLTKSYMLSGPGYLKDCLKTSQTFIDATCSAYDSYEMRVMAAVLAGDPAAAKKALVEYTADEVRASHPESHAVLLGPVSQISAREFAAIMREQAGSAPKNQARKMLISAVVDFFCQRYAPVCDLNKRFKTAFGQASGLAAEADFASALSVCADLLTVKNDVAFAEASALMKKDHIDLPGLILFDTACYALNRREEGLKIIAERQARDPRASILARARILDEMAQPKQALEVLKQLDRVAPGDSDGLLLAARLESQLNKGGEALEALKQLIGKHPDSGVAYMLRAQIYVQKKQFDLALADLGRAINASYCLTKAVRARAGCYAALGKAKAAEDDMKLAEQFTQWVR